MTLLSPRYKNIDNKISRQGGKKKKRDMLFAESVNQFGGQMDRI